LRRLDVPADAVAMLEADGQVVLRLGETGLGRRSQQLYRTGDILRRAAAITHTTF
jgi:hypothetical protein